MSLELLHVRTAKGLPAAYVRPPQRDLLLERSIGEGRHGVHVFIQILRSVPSTRSALYRAMGLKPRDLSSSQTPRLTLRRLATQITSNPAADATRWVQSRPSSTWVRSGGTTRPLGLRLLRRFRLARAV